jgi:hypothetical protein
VSGHEDDAVTTTTITTTHTMTTARMAGLDGVYAGVSPVGDREVVVVFVDRAGTSSVELLGELGQARQLPTDAVAALDAIAAQDVPQSPPGPTVQGEP